MRLTAISDTAQVDSPIVLEKTAPSRNVPLLPYYRPVPHLDQCQTSLKCRGKENNEI